MPLASSRCIRTTLVSRGFKLKNNDELSYESTIKEVISRDKLEKLNGVTTKAKNLELEVPAPSSPLHCGLSQHQSNPPSSKASNTHQRSHLYRTPESTSSQETLDSHLTLLITLAELKHHASSSSITEIVRSIKLLQIILRRSIWHYLKVFSI
ncbi:hypothetical protein RJ639_010329 [Escallonia herrerae]|uniref:Uncharacterized protein n=1 Tax=Escallonia herrerae TaxID=1293975 RepID=A0AA88VYY5_9ASTE|nr:hypothetical protein RJ639_010329 [Escallonia herrerae]